MNWLEKCQHWKEIWNIRQSINAPDNVDLYNFIDKLNEVIDPDDTVVIDSGSAAFVTGQVLKTNRYVSSGRQLDMGFGLSAAIGVCLGKSSGRTILIAGDGGFHTNIQELATLCYLQLPIKIFVINNNGYLTIRNTQQKFLKGNLIGCDKEHGVWLPDWSDIAKTYKIAYKHIKHTDALKGCIEHPSAILCEIFGSEKQEIMPTAAMKNGQSMPLSQMSPFLSDEEYEKEHY